VVPLFRSGSQEILLVLALFRCEGKYGGCRGRERGKEEEKRREEINEIHVEGREGRGVGVGERKGKNNGKKERERVEGRNGRKG
jgi:hypothetical protein